jgi:hypothetical protein
MDLDINIHVDIVAVPALGRAKQSTTLAIAPVE